MPWVVPLDTGTKYARLGAGGVCGDLATEGFFLTTCWFASFRAYMGHSLNSLKGGYIGDYRGLLPATGVLKGDTRSLAYSSHARSKIAVFDSSLGTKVTIRSQEIPGSPYHGYSPP